MQQLHLVGFTADLEGLIFSAKKGARSGAFVVAMDESLLAALEEARKLVSAAAGAEDDLRGGRLKPLPALGRTGRTSTLSVREVQARLRSGSSLAEIADAAGVDEGWVARFAAPVLAEQAAVVSRTLPLVFGTSRKGPSSRPLGESVRWNLVDRGIVVDDTSFEAYWSAFQVTPRQWAVRFTYQSRGRAQVAEWEVDLETGQLTARNRLASDLAHVEAGARRKRPAELADAPAATRRPPAASRKQAGKKAAAPKKAAAKKQTGPKKQTGAKKQAGPKKQAAPRRAAATQSVAARRPSKKTSAPSVAVEPPVAPPPATRPGTRGVTASQASAPPAGSRTIGTPGRARVPTTPYRPTIPPRPTPRPAAASDRTEAVPAPVPAPAASASPARAKPAQAPPLRSVVPAVPVPARPLVIPTPAHRPAEKGNVRRIPAPSAASVAIRDQVGPAAAPGSDPQAGDDRPAILVINAEQAGRRRPET